MSSDQKVVQVSSSRHSNRFRVWPASPAIQTLAALNKYDTLRCYLLNCALLQTVLSRSVRYQPDSDMTDCYRQQLLRFSSETDKTPLRLSSATVATSFSCFLFSRFAAATTLAAFVVYRQTAF